jgi:hypothetical protein
VTPLVIYGIGVAAITCIVTEGPPYPSREALLWLAVAAVLWPLVLAVGLPLWLYLHFAKGRTS